MISKCWCGVCILTSFTLPMILLPHGNNRIDAPTAWSTTTKFVFVSLMFIYIIINWIKIANKLSEPNIRHLNHLIHVIRSILMVVVMSVKIAIYPTKPKKRAPDTITIKQIKQNNPSQKWRKRKKTKANEDVCYVFIHNWQSLPSL